MNSVPNIDSSIIEAFKKLDTTSVSDALDRLGITGGLLGIKPVVNDTTICGQAFTVHYVPCGSVKGTVGDFLDDVKPGQVVVIDNSGRDYCMGRSDGNNSNTDGYSRNSNRWSMQRHTCYKENKISNIYKRYIYGNRKRPCFCGCGKCTRSCLRSSGKAWRYYTWR